jgi:hypothetical protein
VQICVNDSRVELSVSNVNSACVQEETT